MRAVQIRPTLVVNMVLDVASESAQSVAFGAYQEHRYYTRCTGIGNDVLGMGHVRVALLRSNFPSNIRILIVTKQ